MSVDFKTFCELAPAISEARFPVLLRGRHGIGKSQIVYQIAKKMGKLVVERRASQMTEGDLVGLPVVDGNSTKWCPPDWFKMACDEPVVLFFDEVDRATLEVRQGLFELTDSRKLNGHKLHEDTVIFAAINGGEHGDQYQVSDMDPAEADRYAVWDLEPSIQDWLDWGKDNIDPVIWDFINKNHNHLEHKDNFEPNKNYPSRRSWHRLSDTLSKANLVEEASPALFTLAMAFVGLEAATQLNDFVANYDRQVSVDQLLSGKAWDKVNKFDINQHNAMIEKMNAVELFAGKIPPRKMKNLAEYFVRMPAEPAMVLFEKIVTSADVNVPAFHKLKTSKGAIKVHIVKIMKGEQEKKESK
tara:strand:+ start:262 stop:1332 length:1071 start_codon:yes stop_codon:yes gene_type:complete